MGDLDHDIGGQPRTDRGPPDGLGRFCLVEAEALAFVGGEKRIQPPDVLVVIDQPHLCGPVGGGSEFFGVAPFDHEDWHRCASLSEMPESADGTPFTPSPHPGIPRRTVLGYSAATAIAGKALAHRAGAVETRGRVARSGRPIGSAA